MEPRWLQSWKEDGLIYLGGTNDFDLWLDDNKDIRVVWGQTVFEWDWFTWSHEDETYDWDSHDKEDVDRNEVLEESLTYIRIFAPWVEDKIKNKERRND